jgi:hypothetical protein
MQFSHERAFRFNANNKPLTDRSWPFVARCGQCLNSDPKLPDANDRFDTTSSVRVPKGNGRALPDVAESSIS